MNKTTLRNELYVNRGIFSIKISNLNKYAEFYHWKLIKPDRLH